ncbi:TonB family protein [Primorskyibacter flagellatus]|uniref:TonB family protein n=1 Tax=Primorskyibacter flagellatus TaxID=1387277 RepID=A0A917A4U2_9RHOB|nr:TonB family protein [Primorskyibacter flagellatus]GGE27489.1 TonB family protein [Primorskyibacter flagellatus]
MIATSRPLKLVALAGAVALHAALAVALIRDEPVQVEGGGTQAAQIGSSFADMAAGTLTAEEPEDVTEEVTEPDRPTETVTEAEPETLTAEPEPEVLTAAEPEPAPDELAQAEPVTPDTAIPLPPVSEADATPEADTLAALAPETPDGMLALRSAPPETLSADAEPAAPQRTEPEAARPVVPDDTIAAINPDSAVPQISKRPVLRDPAMETPVQKAAPPKPVQKTAQKKAPDAAPKKGNSNQNARAGSAQGSARMADTRSGSGNAGKQAGNAAASNYPGLVNRHLARIRKPSMNRRGVVRMSFAIAPSGGLSGVSVARSSGSAQMDQAAATMIRRAAPFPKPPAGAQRSFTVNIEFR